MLVLGRFALAINPTEADIRALLMQLISVKTPNIIIFRLVPTALDQYLLNLASDWCSVLFVIC